MNKEERLIEYLYGEMPEEERLKFEVQLAKDSALQAELEALRESRHWLNQSPLAQPEPVVLTMSARKSPWKKWGIRAGWAAAVLILLSLLNPRIELRSDSFVFALGVQQDINRSNHIDEPSLAKLESKFFTK